MTDEETINAQHHARLVLVQCAWYREHRDDLIRNAVALGITKVEIARILHMNRGHISDIANTEPGGPRPHPLDCEPPSTPKDDR